MIVVVFFQQEHMLHVGEPHWLRSSEKLLPSQTRDLELLSPLITHIISINTCLTRPFRLFGNTEAQKAVLTDVFIKKKLQLNCSPETGSQIFQLSS